MSSPSISSPVEQMMKKGLSSHWEPTPLVEPFHLQIILQSTTTLKCLFFKEFLGQVNRKAFKNSHRQKVELIKFDGFYLHLSSFKYFDIKLYRTQIDTAFDLEKFFKEILGQTKNSGMFVLKTNKGLKIFHTASLGSTPHI